MAMSHFMAAVRNIVEISLTDTPKSYKNNHKKFKVMFDIVQALVPIAVAVVLPVLIVWIVFRAASNKDNKNAEIIIKAIENNSTVDTDKLVNALSKHGKTPQQLLHLRLLRGIHLYRHRNGNMHRYKIILAARNPSPLQLDDVFRHIPCHRHSLSGGLLRDT